MKTTVQRVITQKIHHIMKSDNSEDPSYNESEDSMGTSEASDWENETIKQEKPEKTVFRRRPLKNMFVSDEKEDAQVDGTKSVKMDRCSEPLPMSSRPEMVDFSVPGTVCLFFLRIFNLNLDSFS